MTPTYLKGLHLTLHPLKTYIGKIAKGFNFLGYYMDNHRLLPSTETLRRFHERALVLYEQPTEPLKRLRHTAKRDISEYSAHEHPPNDHEFKILLVSLLQRGGSSRQSLKASQRIRRYIDQWSRWVRVGISGHVQLISSTQTWLPALYQICTLSDHAYSLIDVKKFASPLYPWGHTN